MHSFMLARYATGLDMICSVLLNIHDKILCQIGGKLVQLVIKVAVILKHHATMSKLQLSKDDVTL